MPTNFHGFQRVLVRGIPAWKKEDVLYYYDTDVVTNPLIIGKVSEGFAEGAEELCSDRVIAFRSKIEVRNRSANPPAKKK